MAFPLAAIGAGIGQFAQDYQRQQEQAKQTMMLQMQLERFKQEQEQLGREREAASGLWAAGLGGGFDQKPTQGLPQIGGGSQGWPSGGPNLVPGGAVAGRGNRLPFGQLYQLALDAGFEPGEKARNAAAISMAESGGYPGAINWNDPGGSFGLMQVNAKAHGPDVARSALDPATAFRESYRISRGGQDFSPWSVYKSGAYRRYLGEPVLGGDAGTATDIAAGTGQFAMPTDAAAALGPPRPTEPPAPRQTSTGLLKVPAGPTEQPGGAVTGPQQARPLTAADVTTSFGGPKTQKLPGGKLVSEDDYPYPYTGPNALPRPATGQPLTVPPAAPTDYSRPPPAVAPPPGAAAAQPTSSLTGTGAVQPGGTQVAQVDPMRLLDQQATTGAQGAAKGLDPSVMGRLSTQAIMQRIDKAMPNADPLAKMMALEKAQKLLAPDQQVQFQLWKMQHQEELRAALAAFQQDQINKRMEDRLAQQDAMRKWQLENSQGTILQTDQGPVRVRPGSNVGEPIDLGGAQVTSGTAKPRKPDQIEVKKEDGSVDRIMAQQMPDGQWVSADERRVPIDTSRGYTVIPGSAASAMGGGRDAAQRERQLISAREVQSDLENVVRLPISVTRGIFGGRTQGPGLLEALKENLAETMTEEDAQLANSALAGLERELSIIVSPVYGGKWAAESFSKLQLKEGQTNHVKLYNISRMKQIAHNALESMITSPKLGEEQKAYAKTMMEALDKAVPWTPGDVLSYRKTGKNKETFGDYVAKRGIAGSDKKPGTEAAGGGPLAGGRGAGKTEDDPAIPANPAEIDKLPPGTFYVDPRDPQNLRKK